MTMPTIGSRDAFVLGYDLGMACAEADTRAIIDRTLEMIPDPDVTSRAAFARDPIERNNGSRAAKNNLFRVAAENELELAAFEPSAEWRARASASIEAALHPRVRAAFELGVVAGDVSHDIFVLRSLAALRPVLSRNASLDREVASSLALIDKGAERLCNLELEGVANAFDLLASRPNFLDRIGSKHEQWIDRALHALGQLSQQFENELPVATAPAGDSERAIEQQILREPARDDLREQYAAAARRRNDPRAKLIELQLTARDLRRRGIPPGYGDLVREASRLIEANPEWTDAVVALGVGAVMHRGFVEEIHCDVSTFLARIDELVAIAPIMHAKLTGAAGRVAEIAACRALGQMQSLSFESNRITDVDIAALAASPYVENLRWLDLGWNKITDAGVDALVTGRARSLLAVHLGSNPCRDPVDEQEYYNETQWDWNQTDRGRELEAVHGRLAWLHPTTPIWPPPMGIV